MDDFELDLNSITNACKEAMEAYMKTMYDVDEMIAAIFGFCDEIEDLVLVKIYKPFYVKKLFVPISMLSEYTGFWNKVKLFFSK